MPLLRSAADPGRGRFVYMRACPQCHGRNGEGVLRDPALPSFGYLNPPLWGPDRFNDGAGMARLSTAAMRLTAPMPITSARLSTSSARSRPRSHA
jgi:thiosulfate dehydrogenase